MLGANGQLGRALRHELPDAEYARREDLDLSAPGFEASRDWDRYGTIINASAYTKVDEAETRSGGRAAWATNAQGVARLARLAQRHGTTLVHVSSDYVFDGSVAPHTEDEPQSPLGMYGASKAAGDLVVGNLERHFLVRTSWVVGEGSNFVRTMTALAARGVDPVVVDDQLGRLTFTSTLAEGIVHLLRTGAPYGTYNLTNSGEVMSWAAIARAVFERAGRSPGDVTGVPTEQYVAGRAAAGRPPSSELDLSRIVATGYLPTDHMDELSRYMARAGTPTPQPGREA